MMEIKKVAKNTEKARSILKMVGLRLEMIKQIKDGRFASPLIEEYYEVIKELITALMAADGYKTLSHMILVKYLENNYADIFTEHELVFTDNLRKLRNRIAYDGYFVKGDYLRRNLKSIRAVISKLEQLLRSKLD